MAVRGELSASDRNGSLAALALGLVAMYGPTFWRAAHTLWTSPDQAHAPLILAVSAWWLWYRRADLAAAVGPGARGRAGLLAWLLLGLGAAMYAIGHAQLAWMLEIGSLIPVLAGAGALLFGWPCVRAARFALAFLVFAIPLPGPAVDALTAPLKRGVSVAADELLYRAGYPVARDGVVISLSQYKLLIADACSGLYSMTSLFALAVLYVNVARPAGRLRNGAILLASLPFAFAANVGRVLLLALITYYAGDAAGQGFLHGSAGIVMFLIALTLIYFFDRLLARFEALGAGLHAAPAAAAGLR